MNECMDRVGLLLSPPPPPTHLISLSPFSMSRQVSFHNMAQVNKTQEVSKISIHLLYVHGYWYTEFPTPLWGSAIILRKRLDYIFLRQK